MKMPRRCNCLLCKEHTSSNMNNKRENSKQVSSHLVEVEHYEQLPNIWIHQTQESLLPQPKKHQLIKKLRTDKHQLKVLETSFSFLSNLPACISKVSMKALAERC